MDIQLERKSELMYQADREFVMFLDFSRIRIELILSVVIEYRIIPIDRSDLKIFDELSLSFRRIRIQYSFNISV